ncbi:MAG: hypothetical protein ACJA1A_002968 [Saprospiraceae bacterium]|jgi:hypothetical protein|tara:strand:+ start:470 stop:616 length:147 start_codon:yes stop_codon:yes gene_type:complete
MNSKTVKIFSRLLALVAVVAVFSSCNRGGVGCPYELEVATNILMQVIK